MDSSIRRAVAAIRKRYSEPLSLDELAKAAFVSKFHLVRTFSDQVGVTPHRFLSAVRLHEAKRMLHGTSLNVVHISTGVGYNSTGSFTNRFTDSVGLTPVQYRRMSRGDPCGQPLRSSIATGEHTVCGTLRVVDPVGSPIFVGVFDSPILQGRPVATAVVGAAGRIEISGVPAGEWRVHAVARDPAPREDTHPDPPLVTGSAMLHVRGPGPHSLRSELVMRSQYWTDPPVLLALPQLTASHDHH